MIQVLNEPTMQKLLQLRLTALAASWTEQQKNPDVNKLSFDERLGLLVDAEHLARTRASRGACVMQSCG